MRVGEDAPQGFADVRLSFRVACDSRSPDICESIDAKLYHYQDYDGREIDAVIQFDDGAWSAFEIKLNPNDTDEAAANLKKVASVFKHNPPTSLSVVVGKSGIAHRREDGVYVLPITSLRP